MGTPRFTKYARQLLPYVEMCGYEFVRVGSNGHFVFERPGFPLYILPSTPSDHHALANDLARLKRRHPEMFVARNDAPERVRTALPDVEFVPRGEITSPWYRHLDSSLEPAEQVYPLPGSPEAVEQGCICGVFRNNHGRGITDSPGTYAYAAGCPVEHDPPVKWTEPEPRCQCGNKLPPRSNGRPRKWCFSCRPSRWDRATEAERERAREAVRRWYWKQHVKEEAA